MKFNKHMTNEEVVYKLNYAYTCNQENFHKVLEIAKERLDKLTELEDLEKDLGIDLTIYHKLMSKLYCGDGDKLFVKDENGKIIEVGILEIDYCKKKIHFYKDNHYDADFTYGFSQYGESFALTKEELENDK